jgi:hypothetical protein
MVPRSPLGVFPILVAMVGLSWEVFRETCGVEAGNFGGSVLTWCL